MGWGLRVYGLGAIALGLVGLAYGDFALQWQPVPRGLPAHQLLAYASGALLVAAGLACLVRRTAAAGALVLALFYGLWVVALHGPGVVARPHVFIEWNGLAEILALAAGGLCAWTGAAALDRAQAAALARTARLVFGLCLLVFAASHVLYLKFTAAMVPGWIPPGQTFWAYATAAGHAAAGLALIANVRARLAAGLLTLMFASFVVVLHAPNVAAKPSHLSWIMLTITLVMTGAAWAVADSAGKA